MELSWKNPGLSFHIFCGNAEKGFKILGQQVETNYQNDPKFVDRQVLANSVDSYQTACPDLLFKKRSLW